MHSRSKIFWALLVLVLLAAGIWYLFFKRATSPETTTKQNREQDEPVRYQPRNDLPDDNETAPTPPQADKPDAGRTYVPGHGWMKKVEDPNAVPPPTKDELPSKTDNEKPEPLRPVTPAWKLKMKSRLLGDMERRIERIEQALEEARKAGDQEAIHRNEILLKRTKMRTKRLRSDVELLKQQVSKSPDGASDGRGAGTGTDSSR